MIPIESIKSSQSTVDYSKKMLLAGIAAGFTLYTSACIPAYATHIKSVSTSDRKIHPVAIKEHFTAIANRSVSRLNRKALELEVESPSGWAIDVSKKIIKHLAAKNAQVEFLNPSQDGGVVLEFTISDTYLLIEVFNDKDIVFLKRKNKNRDVYDATEKNIFKLIDELV